MTEHEPATEKQESLQDQVRRKKHEILWNLRRLAKSGNEEEFKAYLTENCGIQRESSLYKTSLSAFWNAVREFELQRRER